MTINAAFNEELAEVDGTKSFSVTIDTGTHTENEFSVSGYAITAGSNEAASHAAYEAMHELGFRIWSPHWIDRPASLPSGGVTLSKQERVMPYNTIFRNYGSHPDDTTGGDADFNRWAALVACDDARRPIGHAWPAWFDDDRAWFDANPSYWVWRVQDAVPQFVLDESGEPAIWEALAQRAALYLSTRLNSYNRASWDPFDTNGQASDVVFPWVKRCVDVLRTTYGITDAKLGVYAYSSQADPTLVQGLDLSGIYLQAALGFTNAGLGYPEFVRQWGNVIDDGEIGLRAYGDIAAFGSYLVPGSANPGMNFLRDYASFVSNGANGVNMETSTNWPLNIISHYTAIRVWVTGGDPDTIYTQAISDAVSGLFEGDSAVGDLYELWAEGGSATDFVLKKSFDITESMTADSWWKTRFRQFLAMQSLLLDYDNERVTGGPYFTLLEKGMRWAEGLYEQEGAVHSYAIARRIASIGTIVPAGRPDLYVLQDPRPHWYRYPALPTDAEISEIQSELEKRADYPTVTEAADSVDDLVAVSVSPTGAADIGTDSVSLNVDYGISAVYHGPGNVTVTDNETEEAVVTAYGSGLHDVTLDGGSFVEWDAGVMHLKADPRVYMERMNPPGTVWWMYLPHTVQGWDKIECSVRLKATDSEGAKTIDSRDSPTSGYDYPQTLKPGVVCLHFLTVGWLTMAGASPYISSSRTEALMPRPLAMREGLL